MQKANLINLLDGVLAWSELEARIASLPSEQERGGAFEQFCKLFFLLDPVFQFKEVYRHREIPPSLLEQLGYPGRQDIGIDGVAVTIDGKLFAYQAKFRRMGEDKKQEEQEKGTDLFNYSVLFKSVRSMSFFLSFPISWSYLHNTAYRSKIQSQMVVISLWCGKPSGSQNISNPTVI